MSEERVKVLQMLQSGEIGVDEAMERIRALAGAEAAAGDSTDDIQPQAAENPVHAAVEQTATHAEQPSARVRIPLEKATGVNLRGAQLEGVDLTDATLAYANFGDIDLRNANCRTTDFTGANLQGARLTGANLQGANLTGANLHDANFCEANLQDTDLCGANLHGADFRGADLHGKSLSGMNLAGSRYRAGAVELANIVIEV